MDLGVSDIPEWTNPGEAKQYVIEQTLAQALNPLASWKPAAEPETQNVSVMTYSVQEGDTLSEIAHQYGITLKDLIRENRISNPHMVGIGMKLTIRRNEIRHRVKQDETLEQIAGRYGVKPEKIVALNPLIRILSNQLYVGQTVVVPLPASEPMLSGSYPVRRQMAIAASRSQSRMRTLDWPVQDPTITSGFGQRWGKLHKGLDMWNEKKEKTPITAAKEGLVVEAGARSGYGYMVILDHGDGLQTYYAHMRKIIVEPGQYVQKGEKLGYMGRTGDSTGYHLHFEVRQDDVPVNPLRFLTR